MKDRDLTLAKLEGEQLLIISVLEARKLLGQDHIKISSDEVEKLVNELSFLARLIIDNKDLVVNNI